MKLIPGTLLALGASALVSMPAIADEANSSWVDRVSFYGDLRLRYENIDEEGVAGSSRERERGRARIGLKADVSPNVKVIFGLATGGDNPVSRNVTGDGGFTTKEIGFELMYIDWSARDDLSVYAGKMKNPGHTVSCKRLSFREEAREKVLRGATAPADAVRVTIAREPAAPAGMEL